ncbi:MAG TPA: hypothetical protein VMR54_00725 [Thermoanaerobaculia bacterium]|nr:hypothetical protein [Thermoanaerobaculia bacterium]
MRLADGSRAALILVLLTAPVSSTDVRRVALRVPKDSALVPEIERFVSWAARRGIDLQVGSEDAPAAAGTEVVRLWVLPVSEAFGRRLARFPVRLDAKGFSFDGRAYRAADEAIALSDPDGSRETLVLGNGEPAVVHLAARAIFEPGEPGDYRVISGELSKSGRFRRVGKTLAIDRGFDRDEIRSREEFLRSLRSEQRDGARWLFRDSERSAAAAWQSVLARFLSPGPSASLTVRLFPDAASKGRYTGSCRPADVVRDGHGIRVDLDAGAPREPDLVSPVFAAATLAAAQPRLADRATLLLALGAQASGSWWGREVRSFSAFLEAAGVEPSVDEILREDRRVSPILAVGASASWLDAGSRLEGQDAVRRTLLGPSDPLSAALVRWRAASGRERVAAPSRRAAPTAFLRGISYAMSNSLEGGYVSARSHATLERLSRMSANSVSVMPFAYSPGAARPEIEFVHRSPRGETDEGTVRAVADARSLGLSALVKPQIWLAGGAFVGDIAMGSGADWEKWFAAYRRFIVHHAIVAEAVRAALFCVGTELSATEVRAGEWRQTIAAVRLATGAPLLYAANWASGTERVAFWDALDLIGADFYDPLSSDPAATDAELTRGARRAAEPLARLSRRYGKPVVLTEVGYPPVAGAWMAPHDEVSGRRRSPEDAARAVAAVFRALEPEPWWKGVYWWKAFSDGRDARPGEPGFNLLGTPAEKAVAAGFAEAAAQARER